jgi:hypothetical protein
MIIDLILDRKDGDEYKAKSFYNDVVEYGSVGYGISRAMDGGTEKDVKKALCRYIIDNEYNVDICNYIMSVDWLIDDAEKYLDEVESERQVNEEPAESLNDISEVKQDLTDDMTIYDIVFEYLIKNSCIPTSNGSGGLNIDCPYQKKDICKAIGAMWSPRYYRWYLRADRLEKAADIIKKLA